MSVINHTPFPAIAFRQYNLQGTLNGVVSVCGTFHLVANDVLKIADQQHPLILEDRYEGDPHKSIQVRQGALTPFKPATDITLIGNTYAPHGEPTNSWICGLKVGQMEKRLRVHGQRYWIPRSNRERIVGWDLSKSSLASVVQIDWRYAWGGTLPDTLDDEVQDVNHTNPLGCGIVNLTHFDLNKPVPAPQIEALDEPITVWNKDYTPQGFGPMSPWWLPRRQYSGTYDDNWKNVRHPLLPVDFDYRFYQSAPSDMIVDPYLQGDEDIELINLTPPAIHLITKLPNIQLAMRLMRDGEYAYGKLVLDSVHFDLRPSVKRVFLSWRIGFPWADGKGLPELSILENNEV